MKASLARHGPRPRRSLGERPEQPEARPPKPPPVAAGKALAERECKGCHGLDGKGAAPRIPHLAAQRESYLLAALQAYKEGKRTHAALRDIAAHMSEATRSTWPRTTRAAAGPGGRDPREGTGSAPYEQGKALAAAAPSATARMATARSPERRAWPASSRITSWSRSRNTWPRSAKPRRCTRCCASEPARHRKARAVFRIANAHRAQRRRVGDPAAGEPLSAVCGGCHGSHGVSIDTATPTLAGQDPRYLVDAIKAYRTTAQTRKHAALRHRAERQGDREHRRVLLRAEIKAVERGQTLVKELTEKCKRCHGGGRESLNGGAEDRQGPRLPGDGAARVSR